MAQVRLHKAIADAGLASRRAAEEMIRQGRVAVNGQVVTVMGVTVDPHSDSITVDGNPLGKADRKRTYLFYKPVGLICTREDTHGRKTVFDILPEEVGTGLHSAGRLDMDAEGLLILTNDGELTRTLTHPSSHLHKTYLVKVKGEVQLNALKKLRRGVELDDGVTLPASVSVIKGKGTDRNTWLRIVLREGRKNQIKRMGEVVGHRVISIKRISIGGIPLPDKMKPGSFKKLSKKEIETLIGGKEKNVQRSTFNVQRAGSGPGSSTFANASRPASTFANRLRQGFDGQEATADKMADRESRGRRGKIVQSPKSKVQSSETVLGPEDSPQKAKSREDHRGGVSQRPASRGPQKKSRPKVSGKGSRAEQEEWTTKHPGKKGTPKPGSQRGKPGERSRRGRGN